MNLQQHPFPILYLGEEGRKLGSEIEPRQKGRVGESVFSIVSSSHHPTLPLIDKTLNEPSPRRASFASDGNSCAISLSLSQPRSFFSLFSPQSC